MFAFGTSFSWDAAPYASPGVHDAASGQLVVFTIKVTNVGKETGVPRQIWDELPYGFRYVPGSMSVSGASPEQSHFDPEVGVNNTYAGLPVLVWNLGGETPLAHGETIQLTFTVRVMIGDGNYQNIAGAEVQHLADYQVDPYKSLVQALSSKTLVWVGDPLLVVATTDTPVVLPNKPIQVTITITSGYYPVVPLSYIWDIRAAPVHL